MINFSPATRIFVALAPVDMRQGFNGLCNRVRGVLGQDPFQGHLYVFSNRMRDPFSTTFPGHPPSLSIKRLTKWK